MSPSSTSDRYRLRDLLADPGTPAILELDFDHNPSAGILTQYVTAADCDGTNVTVADPW